MTNGVDTSPNPVVTQLLGGGEPPLDIGIFVGYFGPSKKDNYVRLYTALDFRCYYELPTAGLLSTKPIDAKDPNSATRVIVKGNTAVDFVQIQTAQARYLSGPIACNNLDRAKDKGVFCGGIHPFAASVDGPCCNTAGQHCTNVNTRCT
jgi:hypothetical protein